MRIKFPILVFFVLAMSGQRGIVVADNQVAVDKGAQVLQNGNAFDAAVTTALVLGITHPQSSGIGGGGFHLHDLHRSGRWLGLVEPCGA